jgi:hypothetical protein
MAASFPIAAPPTVAAASLRARRHTLTPDPRSSWPHAS